MDTDPGSEIFLTPDPVSGMEKFGSRIWDKLPDPQHRYLLDTKMVNVMDWSKNFVLLGLKNKAESFLVV